MTFVEAMNYFYYRSSLGELRWMQRENYSFGLSYHSMLCLNIIAGLPDCTVSRLAEMLGISTPGITEKVNGLVRKGLVEKTQSEKDRRVFLIKLKPEIKAVYESWDRISAELETRLLEKYSKEEIMLFSKILTDAADYESGE
ncbi:MAG: MarR family winged helix-turn-helix transcriptional regulator [Treponema sp.]|jgi:DNA-binding MarR family transcriptional regulator|nr:MarR family winged helix-turn-helix transcriptional regulator [Treponema sp.]